MRRNVWLIITLLLIGAVVFLGSANSAPIEPMVSGLMVAGS
jgi:hypothetical protein